MAKVSLYETASREVGPVEELLKAVLAVNWHRAAALDLGWDVSLDVGDAGLAISISRTDCWPSASSEEDAQRGAETP
jgi:hypothetical protein